MESTLESRPILTREKPLDVFGSLHGPVKAPVQADGMTVIREGHGTGEGRGTTPSEVHDIALKTAETDATKRALAAFGKPFGLELYRGSKSASQKQLLSPPGPLVAETRVGLQADDATAILRPSYAGRIDKSVLTIPETKRLRDKEHLKFVASQPCLICGRQPCDPHHLRFASPVGWRSRSVTNSQCRSAVVNASKSCDFGNLKMLAGHLPFRAARSPRPQGEANSPAAPPRHQDEVHSADVAR